MIRSSILVLRTPRSASSWPPTWDLGDVLARTRSEDEIVSATFSLSSAAPHLFGARLAAFERDLRELLRRASPDGSFAERTRGIALDIWRPD